MSSKTSEKSTASTPATTGSQELAATASSDSPSSALSPTRVTRLQEKLQLQNLNDRLAAYIDQVRFLENENSRLSGQDQTNEEVITSEVSTIKSMYERELSDVRKTLDDTARDKARLQIEVSKWQNEMEEATSQLIKKEKKIADTEKDLVQSESQVQILQATLDRLSIEKRRVENFLKEAEGDRNKLAEQLTAARNKLEEETVYKVDLLNKMQSMKEEFSFKETVHEQELSESRVLKQTEISDVDLNLQYEQKLADTLKDIRQQFESQIKFNRNEVDSLHEKKLNDLQKLCAQYTSDTGKANEELRTFRTKVETLTSKITELECQNASLKGRIKDLEGLLEQEREWHQLAIEGKDEEIKSLRDDVQHQLQEYRDLLDIKVVLDMEIASYRKLLETEECRLNISTPEVRRSTPRRTPVRAKRKRTTVQTEKTSKVNIQSSASTKGNVKIIDNDSDGRLVKLFNEGNVDVPLGGWKILQKSNEVETIYELHDSLVIKAKSSVSIWSSGIGAVHNPPSDIVMEGQTWITAESMTTTLLNDNGEEMSLRETSKRVYRPLSDLQSNEELYHQQG